MHDSHRDFHKAELSPGLPCRYIADLEAVQKYQCALLRLMLSAGGNDCKHRNLTLSDTLSICSTQPSPITPACSMSRTLCNRAHARAEQFLNS